MNKYKKLIELIKNNGLEIQSKKCYDPVRVDYADLDNPILKIETLEGLMIATEGDYIIKGVQGKFYPCKPDIFAQTYEKTEE